MLVLLPETAPCGMCVTECVSMAGEGVNEDVKTKEIGRRGQWLSPELVLEVNPPPLFAWVDVFI